MHFSNDTLKFGEKPPAKLDWNYYFVICVFTLCQELLLFKGLKRPLESHARFSQIEHH